MTGFLPCPFCGGIPVLISRYESGSPSDSALSCSCGIKTKWIPRAVYDRDRYAKEGPESEYSGAYYSRDWLKELIAFWNKRWT